MNSRTRVIYIGYHAETLLLLYKERSFEVVTIGRIQEFLSDRTVNPINLLFKAIYALRCRNKYRTLESLLLRLWTITSGLSTSYYRRYSDYLKAISKHNTVIINIDNSQQTADYLKSERIDLMVVCAWEILPAEMIAIPKYGTVNIHPSKLPQYRGALPTLWSLKNRDSESAVTYQLMKEAMDSGDIIGQHTFSITEADDWKSIEIKIDNILQATLAADLKGYIDGRIMPVPQGELNRSTTGRYDEYRKIDWVNEDGASVYNKVNLYPEIVPADYCYTFFNGRKIMFQSMSIIKEGSSLATAGQFWVKGLTLFVKTKDVSVAGRLFSELNLNDSILFLLRRKGEFR